MSATTHIYLRASRDDMIRDADTIRRLWPNATITITSATEGRWTMEVTIP